MTPFLNGMILGFSIAAPVGPIGVLCIRKTLNQGRLYGFISGLGAATADAVYGSIAALGLTLVSQFLINQYLLFQIIGGSFLLYLAFRTFKAAVPNETHHDKSSKGIGSTYWTTFMLTLANPVTILTFAGLFSGLKINEGSSSSLLLVLGVFIGSALWWLILSFVAGFIRQMISTRTMKWINYVSGLTLLAFGVYIFSRVM